MTVKEYLHTWKVNWGGAGFTTFINPLLIPFIIQSPKINNINLLVNLLFWTSSNSSFKYLVKFREKTITEKIVREEEISRSREW